MSFHNAASAFVLCVNFSMCVALSPSAAIVLAIWSVDMALTKNTLLEPPRFGASRI